MGKPAIQTMREVFEDLQPFLAMTIVPGVTIGQCAFVSAQRVYSTCYVRPTADNVFAADIDVDLFQAGIGMAGQGLAAGQLMSRSQTNWLDQDGELPDNEVFVGVRTGFHLFVHRQHQGLGAALNAGAVILQTSGATGTTVTDSTIRNLSAARQLAEALSWTLNTGDGMERNCGPLVGYPAGGGVYEPIDPGFATAGIALGVINGLPDPKELQFLPIPIVFPPSVPTRIKIKSGSPQTVAGGFLVGVAGTAEPAVDAVPADYLGIMQIIDGYKLTMPTVAG